MIFQLRGPMGSGKTTIARAVLAKFDCKPTGMLTGSKKRPEAYVSKNDVAVLGPYTATCGGMDAVNSVEESIDLIEKYRRKYRIVFYEGMMLGHIYGRHGAAMIERYGRSHVFAFLDTPLNVCEARVISRRAARGADVKNFDTKNIKQSYETVWSSHDRIKGHGGFVITLRDETAKDDVLKYLTRELKRKTK